MASSDIKYPSDVAAEFFSQEEQTRRAFEKFSGSRFSPPARPTQSVLTQLVETMLFASMATEEGRLTPVGIVFAENTLPFYAEAPAWDFVQLASSLDFEVNSIAKLASVCGSRDSLLVVMPKSETLALVGIATPHSRRFSTDTDDLVRILTLKPGVISVRSGASEIVRYERGKLRRKIPFPLGRGKQWRAQLDSIEQTVFREELPRLQVDVVDSLLQIVQGMVQLGHGGLLCVLGPDDEPGSLLNGAKKLRAPLPFGVALRDMYKAQLVDNSNTANRLSFEPRNSRPPTEEEERDAEDARAAASRVSRLVEQIARLTTFDGAVVMSHALEVLAFGVKLSSKKEEDKKEEEVPTVLSVTEDRRPGQAWPLATRGTRHRAAAFFAKQHPRGLAFIVSQDGDAAIFQKLESELVYWPLPL
ncbi:MAG: hypothetical protein JXB05_27215 [Myxococcaceae bacterium]|nr:hypothetical protein [Myxococcaceae bacterium]